MSDTYYEILVKRKTDNTVLAKKILLMCGIVFCLVGVVFLTPIFFLGALGFGVACWLLFPKFDIEYEYLLVNGELDIDVIYSQSKRKKIAQYDLNSMDMLAPLNSTHLDYYNGNTTLKVVDYSSREEGKVPYAMITRDKTGTVKVLLELTQEAVENLRRTYPNKVYLD